MRLSTKTAGIFSCLTFLIIGSIVLLKDMSLDYNTVIYACEYGLFGAITAGIFGFFIGKVFESANNPYNKRKPRNDHKNDHKDEE